MKTSKVLQRKNISTDLVVEKLTSQFDSWTEETFASFPHLKLLPTHRTLFNTDVLKMLLESVIKQLDVGLVLQVLNEDALAVLEKVVHLVLGLTVTFTLKAIDSSLMSSQLKRLQAIFETSYTRLDGEKQLELCCPLVKFVPAALTLNTNDFLLTNVEVVLPPQLNLKLGLPKYKTNKMAGFKDFVSKTHPYPIIDFLTAVGAEVQVHKLSDKYGLETAVLDPYKQYFTLGGITYIMPRYEPSVMILYFTAHHNQRILSCSYHPKLKTFLFNISDSSLPGTNEKNSEAESTTVEREWSISSVVRLSIVSSADPLVLAPELLAASSSLVY